VTNGMIFLEGTVDDLSQAARAEMVANLYLPEATPENAIIKNESGPFKQQKGAGGSGRKIIYSLILVNPAPPRKAEKLIRVTVHYVELKKDYTRGFGFQWNPSFASNGPSVSFGQNPDGTTGSSSGTFTGTLSNLLPKLSSANAAGFVRILKQGTVIVKNGIKAKIYDGVVTQVTGLTVQGAPTALPAINLGLTVEVTPKILPNTDDIEMDLMVDNTSAVGSTQSQSTKRINTTVFVRSRESAALASVDSGSNTTDFNRNPGSEESSPVFNLNRKKEIAKTKSQFVIFVTPEILEDASSGTAELKKNFRIKVK
jgi:pilus assembly protein CpaC